MPDRLAEAAAILSERLQATASVSVTYRRGVYSVTFLATQGSKLLKVTNTAGAVKIVRTDAEFVFPAAELILSGSLTEPVRGDFVDRAWPDGVTRRYMVLSPGGEEPEWHYADHDRVMIRVHVKFVGAV